MSIEASSDPVRQEALAGLIGSLVNQGHPVQYAQVMATSIIFQTDLDLRNAQMARLLNWLKQEHKDIYASSLVIVEETREEFEHRVQEG
ncbi:MULTISPECIES: hypothetical protein [unclassified Nostoc]|uniref:hypothetical protein n=1 Tax=unclassified Nostoc TaxID=2593658 RepID=UPI001D2AEF23|nr:MULTISPECIES: hypothetical protein [unclassified Nostoc]MBN3877071.1 hypothetical protein [Nostoc sp. JL23]MBN3892416.1 hypothetical protein [Nostoc sp. JL31]